MSTRNTSLIFSSHPEGYPIPGKDLTLSTSTIDLTTPPPTGGLLLKTNYISYDPFLRGRMNPPNPATYAAGFTVGSPLYNNGISTVIATSNPRFQEGDVVLGTVNFSEYNIIEKERADTPGRTGGYGGGFMKLENPLGLDVEIFLGALGMPGLTAYSGIKEFGKIKKGDVVFVSAASGAVGQLVGQLAKKEGAKVIGSVGSPDKLEFIVKELGFDVGFNYKEESAISALKRIFQQLDVKGLDFYFDNVGGEQLDAALELSNVRGRILQCGSISQVNRTTGEKYGIKNMPLVVSKRLTIQGFLVFDEEYGPKWADAHQRDVQQWIKDGDFKVKTHVTNGIENAAEGLVEIFKGGNFGKAVLKVADI